MSDLLAKVHAKARQWLDSSVIDSDTKKEIHDLLDSADSKTLVDHFYKDLEFGTGGLRGIMGAGSNCMNRYTVGVATQGLSNYLLKSFPGQKISVAIAHDSRNNSRYFAEVTAGVFSANGITVHLFPELRPTPLLSFAIRYLKCQSGVVVTASHNPKEYNGYKAYWTDGAQVVPPHDENIIHEVEAIKSFEQVKFGPVKENIHAIGPEVQEAYFKEVVRILPNQDIVARQHNAPIVYSSLHGAGITMVPECLKLIGFTNVHVVEEQRTPDGNFPTVASPNPEERAAMKMALEKAEKEKAAVVMATDPDTDRVGIGVRKPEGDFILLNGNQALSMMVWFILRNLKEKAGAYIAKTIVTTELVDAMCAKAGVKCYNTLTGFKYIAQLMRDLEGKEKFIAAGEESYGYMVGNFVRDKDAVSACAFFAVMNACALDEGKTLYDWLIELYVENSFYKEHLINIVKKGQEGEQAIKAMMTALRNQHPSEVNGSKVVRVLDYLSGVETDRETGEKKTLHFPKSDVLQFYLADGTKISARPSGTEPKIKFYISVNTKLKSKGLFPVKSQELDGRIEGVSKFVMKLVEG